jgi:sulfite reductase alpha subunit-like flavoprotein
MGSGSSASPSRRYSSSGIETGSDAVKSERLVSPKDAVAPPFSSNDHTSRRLSQLNFTADKQLEGYNGILTSKTTVVNENSENELEINFKCVQLENNSSTTPVVILANRKPRSGSQQFFNFYEIPILEKRNLCQSSDTNPASSVTYHLELDISLVGLRYDVADAIMILPENPSEEVETMAKFFHIDLDNSSYDFEADFNDFLLPFPAPFTIRKVLTCYLDLMVSHHLFSYSFFLSDCVSPSLSLSAG